MTTAREALLDTMTPEEYSYATSDGHNLAKLAAGAVAGWAAGVLVRKSYDKLYWVRHARKAAKAVEVVTD